MSEMFKLVLIGAVDHNRYKKAAAEAQARAEAQAEPEAERPAKQPRLEGGDTIGPLWERGVCHPQACLQGIPPSLLQHNGFVSSHSIQNNFSINGYCDDRVWCVDTGRSLSFAPPLPRYFTAVDTASFRFMFHAARAEVLEIIGPESSTPDVVVHRFAPPAGMVKTKGVFWNQPPSS